MNRKNIPAFFVVLFLPQCISLSSNAADDWDQLPNWIGQWKISPEVGTILGFDKMVDLPKYPKTIQFSFMVDKNAAVATVGKKKIQAAESLLVKMKHKIIAAGKWKTNSGFEGYASRDEFCFVTQREGITFVWIGSPSESLLGAEVHYVRGKEPQQDLLLLDFGMSNLRKKRSKFFPSSAAGFTRVD